jgi:hypothetical protein
MSIAQNLRQLIEPRAYLYFLSYTWFDTTDPFAELLSILLPDCFIDRACLPTGTNVSDETIKGAVHARCLVLYINKRYLGSTACLKELFAAIFHRRGCGNTAALCDISGLEDKMKDENPPPAVVDWDALEVILEEAFPSAVFFDTGDFLRWVRRDHDLSDGGSAERDSTISWFRDHKRVSLSTKLSSKGELLSSFPTRSMMAGEWDSGSLFERAIALLANFKIVTDPYADFPRAGMKRLLCNEVKCVPRQFGTIPDHKFIFLSNIFLAANGLIALCDAFFVSVGAPKHSLAYNSAVGLVDAGAFVVDMLAVLCSVFLGFVITKSLENIDPRLFYSDYLEPLCLAARIFEKEQEQPFMVRDLQVNNDLETPLMHFKVSDNDVPAVRVYDDICDRNYDFCVRIILLQDHQQDSAKAAKRDASLRALRDFLNDGLGLPAIFLLHDEWAGAELNADREGKRIPRGLVVCVLDSVEHAHIDKWSKMLQALAPECIVPVVCRVPPEDEDEVNKVAYVRGWHKEPKLYERRLGELVLRALACKVGAAILREDIWRGTARVKDFGAQCDEAMLCESARGGGGVRRGEGGEGKDVIEFMHLAHLRHFIL